ncbi:MAG: methylmalonyl Co-A mutase-associated GTPase MeaB [Bacteroidota bacterium]
MADIDNMKKKVLSGDPVALGKAITLIESKKDEDRLTANQLLSEILSQTGNSLRIGITGVPGVGKSTFIDTLGELITSQGKKLAVLAIDPSSPQSKGSILGDKTRMSKLAGNQNAFIRPSASGGNLGGVASNTMDSILLCEAAGYDVVLIETVGVGQSEVAVKNMTDVFLLLMLAGAGDELQGIKRGIMEMADILVINKADGDNIANANLARKAYENALHLFSPRETGWSPPVLTCSSISGKGVENVWYQVNEYAESISKNGELKNIREEQKKHWLESMLSAEVMDHIQKDKQLQPILTKLEKEVLKGNLTPQQAVQDILNAFFGRQG